MSYHAIRHIAVAAGSSVPVGIVASRLLPGWNLLVRDVGVSGAWIVQAIFHFIYAFFISVGVVLFLVAAARFDSSPPTPVTGAAAAITVIVADVLFGVWRIKVNGVITLGVALVLGSWTTCLVLSMLRKALARPGTATR
jgi:heme A synthase